MDENAYAHKHAHIKHLKSQIINVITEFVLLLTVLATTLMYWMAIYKIKQCLRFYYFMGGGGREKQENFNKKYYFQYSKNRENMTIKVMKMLARKY